MASRKAGYTIEAGFSGRFGAGMIERLNKFLFSVTRPKAEGQEAQKNKLTTENYLLKSIYVPYKNQERIQQPFV